jgi:hypothetical protein
MWTNMHKEKTDINLFMTIIGDNYDFRDNLKPFKVEITNRNKVTFVNYGRNEFI